MGMDGEEKHSSRRRLKDGSDQPFAVGDMVKLRDSSKREHHHVPTRINESADLWPDPYSRSGWLTVPTQRLEADDTAIILEIHEVSYRVLTSKGHLGWVETWDLEKV